MKKFLDIDGLQHLVEQLSGIIKQTALDGLNFKIVETLPAVGEDNVIYFLDTPGNAHYSMHIYSNENGGEWKQLGDGVGVEIEAISNAEIQAIIDSVK